MGRARRVKIGVVVVALAASVVGGGAYAVDRLDVLDSEQPQRAAAAVPDHADRTTPASSPAPSSTPAARTAPKSPSPAPQPVDVVEPPRSPDLPEARFKVGDKGEGVRELQSRLDQLAWWYGDITGTYATTTIKAVSGFQAKRKLPTTGQVDERTWQRLAAMTRMPTYNEMHNILVPGPTIIGPEDTSEDVRELQARLAQIGWFYEGVTNYYGDDTTAAVEGFQAKREIPVTGEVDQRTWNRLAEMTVAPTEYEMYPERAPEVEETGTTLDPRCLVGRVLCIDKSTNSLSWVIDGQVQSTVDVRFGSDETPTDEGEFEVYLKSEDHVSSLFDTSMPYAMFFSGGQAVHYSPDFAANGYYGASHGCVNVRDYDAIQLMFDEVQIGDDVVVYWS